LWFTREHAPYALNKAGIKVVCCGILCENILQKFGDGGFFIPYESEGKINNKIKTGDTVEIDTLENIIILAEMVRNII
jgi:3-isopropylmalate/(R)-2-methylmalate dehydratase small subunit